MTEQPQTPDQRDAAGQQPAPSPPVGEPKPPVAPPPPAAPPEPGRGEGAAAGVEAAPSSPAPPAPVPPPPVAQPSASAPPLGASLAAADRSPPGGVAHDRPEVLAGAAFAGGFLVAMILKRLAG